MLKYVLPAIAAGFVSGTAPAQSPPVESLTLHAAQAKVRQFSPALQSLAYDIKAVDGQVQQARLLPNPELSALVEDHQRPTRTTTIELTQSIETGGKRGARIDVAERERDVAQLTLQAKQAEVRASTSKAFHALLAAQERMNLADTSHTLARQALAAASSRVAAGKNSPVDESRARIAASGAEIELVQARADVDAARESLAALWGGTAQDVGRAEGRLDQLPEAAPLSVLTARLEQAPGIALARMALQRREALGRVEKARRVPDLAVTFGSRKDEQFGRRQAVFGLSVPLPLFDRNQGRMLEALQRTEQARIDLAAASAALASELRTAHARLQTAQAQAKSLRDDHLPGARSASEAARKGYEYGKFGILDVFDAQRVLLQAQAHHLRVLAEAHAAAADIDRILGASGAAQP